MATFVIPVRLKSDPSIIKIRDSIKDGQKIKSLTVKMEATHSGIVNGNSWFYTPEGMKNGASSFVTPTNAPVTLEHDPNSPILGRVTDSRYVDYKMKSLHIQDRKSSGFRQTIKDHLNSVRGNGKYKGLGHIELIAKITDSDAINRILDGEYIGVSVGGTTKSAVCSICGTDKMHSSCDHKPGHFYDSEKCFLIGGDMKFDHITYTARPADKNAASMIIRDSEDVSSSLSILDFEIITKDNSMKLNLSEVAKSNDALVQHASDLGIKDFTIQSGDDISVADYLFGDEKTFPIATKEQAALVLDYLKTKVEDGKELQSAVTVVEDKMAEFGEDYTKVIEDMKAAQAAPVEDSKVEEQKVEQSPIDVEQLKDSIALAVVEQLQSVLTVQDSFSSNRIRTLTQENKRLSEQVNAINVRLRDSLVGQICAIAQIEDSDKINQLKQRTIASLEDKLQDMQEQSAKKDETIVEDSAKGEVLPENSVTLDSVSETEIKDSNVEPEGEKEPEAKQDEIKVMDSREFKELYKSTVRQGGFAAGKKLTEEMRAAGTLPAGY